MRYEKPASLDRALALLAEHAGWRPLAGGTDLYPATTAPTLDGDILDLNGIGELRGIAEDEAGWRIGARTTWTDIVRADLPPAFEALKQAAREVGSVQIQTMGTLAGNLCNASPAADGVPALLVLDAAVELRSAAGTRRLALADFILGNRKTARRPDELVTAILCPRASLPGRSRFEKLGARRYLVISIAMVAARLAVSAGRIADAAIAVGACSVVARRLPEVERRLIGQPTGLIGRALDGLDLGDALAPIDDVRATADYRNHAAAELVRRSVAGALAEAA